MCNATFVPCSSPIGYITSTYVHDKHKQCSIRKIPHPDNETNGHRSKSSTDFPVDLGTNTCRTTRIIHRQPVPTLPLIHTIITRATVGSNARVLQKTGISIAIPIRSGLEKSYPVYASVHNGYFSQKETTANRSFIKKPAIEIDQRSTAPGAAGMPKTTCPSFRYPYCCTPH